jgi:hypothetical protein
MADGSKSIRSGAVGEGGAAGSGAPRLLGPAGRREESRRKVEAIALTMFARHGFEAVRVLAACFDIVRHQTNMHV